MGALWHPFSDMGAIESGGEFVITRGEGVRVFDDSGRSYLDATAGLWFAAAVIIGVVLYSAVLSIRSL